ncbi:M48 family metallopeptidase [Beggiatoa leptomitoformis]|uniref:M48 family metalloprotease n=1 Tax=Beggiatoa leptomitoformis TaxID=288004 RepID=A0A2N9YHA3_9GAMM|nr:M48 family metallopeptidase [Beggiatoa leptomitoformis]ALG67863.1 M48 family metalloprotease [Beggiatoa leptomitoformis]AUI69877.1 M48 family metalloprotease [Beggiatoa leptomitoformis]
MLKVDFFGQQDQAQQKTRWLILYFIIALFVIIGFINLTFFLVGKFISLHHYQLSQWLQSPASHWVIGITLMVILGGTIRRLYQLREGGEALAIMIGATPIEPDTYREEERRLMNVVEEMAIAAGIPVPALYVLQMEHGINSFVAGYHASDVTLVVTRGALEQLDRRELQGVIGHEFSHILQGDMRLNLHLIGILAGILAIGQMGFYLLTGGTYQYEDRLNRNLRDLNIFPFALPFSILLISLGYIGLFCGRVIKSAISRQREFLADAAAVQYTRDPACLVGALLKIKGHRIGSKLYNYRAEEVSHLCFGSAFNLSRLLATHPTLDERITRIDRAYPYRLKYGKLGEQTASQQTAPLSEEYLSFQSTPTVRPPTTKTTVVASIGNPTPEHLAYATKIYQQIPKNILTLVHQQTGAKIITYALLFQGKVADKQAREIVLNTAESTEITQQVIALRQQLDTLGNQVRVPLLDLALPALKKLPYVERTTYLTIINDLIKADGKVSLFEYVLETILRHHLDTHTMRTSTVSYKNLAEALPDISLILSLLAHVGSGQSAYTIALKTLTTQPLPFASIVACKPEKLNGAINRLKYLTPQLKKSVIDACVTCVLADKQVETAELEVLRAVVESLDCPMPPLIG